MFLNARLIAFASAALICATPALAEVDCGQILKYGVFEVTSETGQFASESAFRNYVCNEDSSKSSTGADGNWAWGYLEGSYSNAREDYKKYCSEETESSQLSAEWNNFRTKASDVLANAWVQCIKQQDDVGKPAFALYYLTDPHYFRFDARYRAVSPNPEDRSIPYELVIAPKPGTGAFSCRDDRDRYNDPTSTTEDFVVGPFSSLTCRRLDETQTYDIELKPLANRADVPSHSFRVLGRYKPVSRVVTATDAFTVMACTHQHCDKSYYDKMGDDVSSIEGRFVSLDSDDKWSTIDLPKKFRDMDIVDTEEHNLSCRVDSNSHMGKLRLKKAKFTPDGDHLEIWGDYEDLKPEGHGWSFGSHQGQTCTFSFQNRVWQ